MPPNVLIVITDDQTLDTLPTLSGPPAMPWLQSQMLDPDGHWIRFSQAVANTPLCCPSRASILTGLTSSNTGVESNQDGDDLDESATLATWLGGSGYTTALIGKYLNGFPWNRGPYVPTGWDRFLAKLNQERETTYYDYHLIDQGVPLFVGTFPDGYATSFLADAAVRFLRAAPTIKPWFMVYAPPAPHSPRLPAPSDIGVFDDVALDAPDLATLNDVRGKPPWVRSLPPITPERQLRFLIDRRHEREALLAVDRAVQAMLDEVQARGESGRTVVILIGDNGFSFGEHRWVGKRCPYEACVRVPLAIMVPWAVAGVQGEPVSNLDLAPTILDLARAPSVVGVPFDGRSLLPLFTANGQPEVHPEGVLLRYAGDRTIPAWSAVRTRTLKYIEYVDGSVELYDLAGVLGPADPNELVNVAFEPRYAAARSVLRARLMALLRAEDHG